MGSERKMGRGMRGGEGQTEEREGGGSLGRREKVLNGPKGNKKGPDIL